MEGTGLVELSTENEQMQNDRLSCLASGMIQSTCARCPHLSFPLLKRHQHMATPIHYFIESLRMKEPSLALIDVLYLRTPI